ncbi:MAG: hypothetical protein RL479_2549 [Verrucomicrobiota bacterium]
MRLARSLTLPVRFSTCNAEYPLKLVTLARNHAAVSLGLEVAVVGEAPW